MDIPTGIIVLWPSTNGSIPANFTRVTSLDTKYAKGANGENTQNVAGGATTHTHTSPTHKHSITPHTHTYQTNSHVVSGNSNQDNAINNLLSGSEPHTGVSGPANGGDTSLDAVTYGAAANDPPYKKIIFIQAGVSAALPTGIIMLFADASIPSHWQNSDGTGGTVDYRNKYLKGADAAGDAGGTGGSTTNVHDISHSHSSVAAHTHDAANCYPANYPASPSRNDAVDIGSDVRSSHVHSVDLNSATQAISALSASLTTAETVEPLYKKLLALTNIDDTNLEHGLIGLWLGSIATIPSGWFLCDGSSGTPDMRGYHLKIAQTTGEIGNTGGSNTHTHAAQAHSHAASGSHTHTGNITGHSGEVRHNIGNNLGQKVAAADQPFHTLSSISSETIAYQNANTTANSSNNEPQYITAHFIMFSVVSNVVTKSAKYTVKTLNHQVTLSGKYTVKTTQTPLTLPAGYHIQKQYNDLYIERSTTYTDRYV